MYQIMEEQNNRPISFTCRQIFQKVKSNVLTAKIKAQRTLVWKNNKKDNGKSELIISLLIGRPVPPIYCNRIKSEDEKNSNKYKYEILDGQQRTMTITEFLNGEFALVGIGEIKDQFGEVYNIEGMTHEELPESIKHFLDNVSISIIYMEDLTDLEKKDVISRLNNGKSFTATEKIRVVAKSSDEFTELANHELFDCIMTKSAIRGYKNEKIVHNMFVLLYYDKILQKGYVEPLLKSVEITDEQYKEISDLLDYFFMVYDFCRDDEITDIYSGLTNIPSLANQMKIALDNNKDVECIFDWLKDFFVTNSNSAEYVLYNKMSRDASGSKTNCEGRIKIIEDSYNRFFEIDNEHTQKLRKEITQLIKKNLEQPIDSKKKAV